VPEKSDQIIISDFIGNRSSNPAEYKID